MTIVVIIVYSIPALLYRNMTIFLQILQMISNTHRDSILHQALAKPVWDLAVKVMDMFEMGKM